MNSDRDLSCPWRMITGGLCIEGRCTNRHCPAYDQLVIINLGYGEFDHARIVYQRNNVCPMCHYKIHPTKYRLNRCQWWYVQHYSLESFPLHTVGDMYELHDLTGEYLVMEVMPLQQSSRILSEITCSICLIDIDSDREVVDLQCSHTFHSACIDAWLNSGKEMATSCPVCRKYIVKKR